MKEITITISPKWVKFINSPLGKLAQALAGVSVSFAPLFLYYYGQGRHALGPAWLGIPICWIIILLSGFYHIKLSQYVERQLRKKQ